MLKRIKEFFKRKPLPSGKFRGDITHIACVVSIDTAVWVHQLRKGQPHIDASWWAGDTMIVNAEFYSSEGPIAKFIVEKAVDDGKTLSLKLRKRFTIFEPDFYPEIIIHKVTGELHVHGRQWFDLRGRLSLFVTRTCTPQETAEFKAAAF